MTLALSEVLKVTQSRLGANIMRDLLRQVPVLRMIPIRPIEAFELKETRWQTLPTVGTRAIGGTWTASEGTLEQFATTVHVYGGDIAVDRLLTMVNAQENPIQTQTEMKTAALAARFNYDFINGDHAVDPLGMEGLAKLAANAPSRMTINLETAGDTLKVLASSTTEHTFIDALHQALHILGAGFSEDGGKDVNIAAFMNETTLLGVSQVLRRLGLNKTITDAFTRRWDSFGPAKLIDIGLKSDQSTEIISSTQTAGDGGADSTDIYFVRFGGVPQTAADGAVEMIDDSGVQLLQLNGTGLEPYDPLKGGEGGAGANPAYLRRIEWVIGLHQRAKYSVVRLKGFKMAAS